MRAILFIGFAISLSVQVIYINNQSRKKSLLLCYFFCIAGSLLMMVSQKIEVACVGLFIIGLGNMNPTKFGLAIISEITEQTLANKFISSTPIGVTIGGILTPVFYEAINNWRLFTLYFQLLPSILVFLVIFFIFEDTPQSMMKTGECDDICKALNRIGKINKGQSNIVSREEIEEYLREERKREEIKESTNPIDLFRYPSLRLTTICFIFIELIINLIYLANGFLLTLVGFN